MKSQADALGYELEIYSAQNMKKRELDAVVKAINTNVSGIIISPISSLFLHSL